jgi:hypothetical protein
MRVQLNVALVRYFILRHRQQERLSLRRFRFSGIGDGFGHFEYSLTCRARDLAADRPERYDGKGAVSCAGFAPRLVVWSMGRQNWTSPEAVYG